MGGQNGSVYEKTVERYNLDRDIWESSPPLNKQRSRASSCRHDDFVYVFCGLAEEGAINTIERVALKSMHSGWELIEPTQRLTPRF